MLITKKDKSFTLLLISLILIVYSIFSLSSFFKLFSYHQNYKILTGEKYWLNVNQEPVNKDLRSRIILLSFLNDDDVMLEQIIDSKNIKSNFGRNISLILVYSGNKEVDTIGNILHKNDTGFPIIFDKYSNVFNYFKPNKNKFILLNEKGDIYGKYRIEDFNKIEKDIEKLVNILPNIKEENFKISQKRATPSYILSNPTSISYINNKLVGNKTNILIANSGHNNIIISSLDGRIIKKIGSKIAGLQDGEINDALFNYPQDFVIDNNMIYIADSGNNSIRKVNLKSKKVFTIVGSGKKKGSYLKGTVAAKKANLWFPNSLTLSSDKKELIISNYGAGQLLSYHIKNQTLSSLTDAKLNIKARNIINYTNRIYFIDQDIIKYLDKNNQLHIFQIDGEPVESNAFYIKGNLLFNINNKLQLIQKIDLKSNQTSITKIDNRLVSDLVNIGNFIYLLETNKDKITKINKKNSNIKILDILPKLEITEDKIIKFLPNFNFTDELFVKSNSIINVKMNLRKSWKINHKAPSFINLVEIDGDKKAKLIKIYSWNDIDKNQIFLPKLKNGFTYYIKAIIYYCKDTKNSICMVNQYNKKINTSHDISNKDIKIDFLYPNND